MNQILLVEDDLEICEVIQFFLLERPDYSLTIAHSAEQALPLAKLRRFDLILLDVMLPGMDGIDLCGELRRTTYCPILFISCISDDPTIVRALDMGGDDYLVKPFQAPVLIARIEANLRRCRFLREEIPQMVAGDLELDTQNHTLSKAGQPISLSPTEYELLYFFMKNPERLISFDEIYRTIWQRPSLGDMRALFVHIRHLRQKIEPDPAHPCYIRTHMREGYVFQAPS